MSESYTVKTIQVLKGLEAVRKRPGMYIGGTGPEGLHQLVWEILDNSVDEALNGHCDRIEVVLSADGSVSVADTGRGIPIEKHPTTGKNTVETIFCNLHAGGKFDDDAYKVAGGLHGVGAAVVNALSEKMVVEVERKGLRYRQEFRRGKSVSPLQQVPGSGQTGTKVVFLPDSKIFGDKTFSADLIRERLRTKAFLIAGLTITFADEAQNTVETFCYPGGITDFLQELVNDRTLIDAQPFYYSYKNDLRVEIAMAWTEQTSSSDSIVRELNTHSERRHARNSIPQRNNSSGPGIHRKTKRSSQRAQGDLSRGRERGATGDNFRVSARKSRISRTDQGTAHQRNSTANRASGAECPGNMAASESDPGRGPGRQSGACLAGSGSITGSERPGKPKGCHATPYAPRQIGGL